MRKTFTKTDLQTGDIVEARNGERGVVILEKNCILYQGGGLDELYVFTEDLFVDGLERAGDIFKIYRDPTDPIGFNRLSGSILVFNRIDNKKTKERAAELNEIHDEKKNKVLVYPMYPSYRHCGSQYIGNSYHHRGLTEIDLSLSFAPSETASGETVAELPGTIYVESKPMPDITIGTEIKIIEK